MEASAFDVFLHSFIQAFPLIWLKVADERGLDFQGYFSLSYRQGLAFPVDNDIISCALSVQQQQNIPHTVMFAVGEELVTAVIREGLVLVVFCWSKLGRGGLMLVKVMIKA